MTTKTRSDYVNVSPPICATLSEYVYQVGGHGMKSSKKYQILHDGDGALYKPVQSFPKGEEEIKFYQKIFHPNYNNPVVTELKKFIPKFLGLFSYNDPLKENLYIGIEDLLSQFKLPAVADVKIGQRSYEPDASESKKQAEISKYKWRESVGFLITGIKVYESTPLFLNRYHGRGLDIEEVYTKGIKIFLGSDAVRARILSEKFIAKLHGLLDWFKSQKQMAFIASSILMAYESKVKVTNGVSKVGGGCDDVTIINGGYDTDNVLIKLIDFTHVLPVSDHDHNCIYGIESLIKYFKRVLTDDDY